jgi:MFS family permease
LFLSDLCLAYQGDSKDKEAIMGSTHSEQPTRKRANEELEQFLPPDHKAWYKKGYLVRLNLVAASLVLFSSSNGYDGSLMNGLQALDQWNDFMNTPAGAWLGWLNGIYWVGCFIGYPCGAFIGNEWGRKPAVYIGYALLILGVALQTAAPNDIAFMMARFFLGGASAFFGSTTPLLLNEIAYPTQRGTWNALFMSGWYVGGSVAGWVTFATRTYSSSWAWRLPSLLQGLVPLLALPGFLFSTESPRWLISVGRKEEARAILAKYHAGGDTSSPLVNYEMVEISSAIEAEKEAHNSSSYLEMIKTPGNRRRLFCSITLGVFAQWSGNGVISYYLALILDSIGVKSVEEQTLISACLQVWNLIFSVIAGLLADRVGRRPLFMLSAAIMFISYSLVTGLSGAFDTSGKSGIGAAVIPFLFIFFAGYDIAL